MPAPYQDKKPPPNELAGVYYVSDSQSLGTKPVPDMRRYSEGFENTSETVLSSSVGAIKAAAA
jgi:hypothetical protein